MTGGISYNPGQQQQQQATQNAPAANGFTYTPHRDFRSFEAGLAADKVAAKLQELTSEVPAELQPAPNDFGAGGAVPAMLEVSHMGDLTRTHCFHACSCRQRQPKQWWVSTAQALPKRLDSCRVAECAQADRAQSSHPLDTQLSCMQIAASGRGSLADVIDVLGKLARWPTPQVFPVLDVFRMLVLHGSHARLLAADAGSLEASNPGLGGLIARGLAKDAPPAATLLAMRLACNCCANAQLRVWLWQHCVPLIDLVADAPLAVNKNTRVAVAALMLNFAAAVARGEAPGPEEERIRALSLLCEVQPWNSFLAWCCLPAPIAMHAVLHTLLHTSCNTCRTAPLGMIMQSMSLTLWHASITFFLTFDICGVECR